MLKQIEQSILELNGQLIDTIDINKGPTHLYKFPNDIWMSIELSIKKDFVDVRLGKLYVYNNRIPRIIVSHDINIYKDVLEQLKFINPLKVVVNEIGNVSEYLTFISKSLKLIINNYDFISNFTIYKSGINELERKFKKYNLTNITEYNEVNETKEILNNVKYKKNKDIRYKGVLRNMDLTELVGSLLLVLFAIIGCWMLSLFGLEEKIDSFLLLALIGIAPFLIPVIFVIIIVYNKLPYESINLHPLYLEDDTIVSTDYIINKFDFLVNNGYKLIKKENKKRRYFKFKKFSSIIKLYIKHNVINCYVETENYFEVSLLNSKFVSEGFDVKYYQSNNYEKIDLIVNIINNNINEFLE